MRVVAVLGYSRDGDRSLHPICARRLAHAEQIEVGSVKDVNSFGHAR